MDGYATPFAPTPAEWIEMTTKRLEAELIWQKDRLETAQRDYENTKKLFDEWQAFLEKVNR